MTQNGDYDANNTFNVATDAPFKSDKNGNRDISDDGDAKIPADSCDPEVIEI